MLFLISTSCRELVCIHCLVREFAMPHGGSAARSPKALVMDYGVTMEKPKILLMNQVGGDMAMLPGIARIVVVDYLVLNAMDSLLSSRRYHRDSMGIRHPEQGFAWFVLDCSSVYVKTIVYQPVVGTIETAWESGILSKDLPGLYLIVPLSM